jgi:hypothetical protein
MYCGAHFRLLGNIFVFCAIAGGELAPGGKANRLVKVLSLI